MRKLTIVTEEQLKNRVDYYLETLFHKTSKTATSQQLTQGLTCAVRNIVAESLTVTDDSCVKENMKIACSLSMEFLLGRFTGKTSLNLEIHNSTNKIISELRIDFDAFEDGGLELALGCGGLGRFMLFVNDIFNK